MIVHASTETNSSDGASWVVCEKGMPSGKLVTQLAKLPHKAERFRMDVALSGNVVVQADDLRCVLNGNIVAKGPMINPYLVGEMTGNPKLSSKYNLFGKLMNVESGSVVYDEQHINDPCIKIVLITQINQNSVSATVAGRLSNAKLTLKSSPPLTQEEILSLILFGQGLNQVSADQNCRVKAFSSHMLQGNPLEVLDSFRRRVKLDSIELVDLHDNVNGETTQIVRVGKKFNRVRVFIDQELSSNTNSKMTVQYKVTPELGIDANLSTGKGSSGIGMQWKKKY
jgi:translocation and assembly module TamB